MHAIYRYFMHTISSRIILTRVFLYTKHIITVLAYVNLYLLIGTSLLGKLYHNCGTPYYSVCHMYNHTIIKVFNKVNVYHL